MAIRSLSLSLLLAGAAAAQAQPTPTPTHWSLATGETVSPDHDAMGLSLGWPGARFDYLHGVSDRSDLGVRIEMLWGMENTDTAKFGFGFAVPLRMVMVRKDSLLLGVHFDPGVRVYTDSTLTDVFVRFPVGGVLGVQAADQVRIAAAVDLDLAVETARSTYFEVAPAFGFGIEYLVDKSLQVGLNARFGPEFITVANTGSRFAFTSEVVIGYRL